MKCQHLLIAFFVILTTSCARFQGPAARVAAIPLAVRGAGATFPDPLYQHWTSDFSLRNRTQITYDPVGSEEGIRRLLEGKVDFAVSEWPIVSAGSAEYVLQIPTAIGGVVPIYNVEGVSRPLRFKPEVLARIFAGTIRVWSDPLIRSDNPQATLPNSKIVVVHRSDGSGATRVFSGFLARSSNDWTGEIGFQVHWPPGSIGARGSAGMTKTVQRTRNSIGYVEFGSITQPDVEYGAVQNKAGRFVGADNASIRAAGDNSTGAFSESPVHFADFLQVAQSEAAYPISYVTWLLIPVPSRDPSKAVLRQFLDYILASGQEVAGALQFAPLPTLLAAQARAALPVALESAPVIPEFPWPPPAASARQLVPEAVNAAHTLDEVDNRLVHALTEAGYTERDYYPVPGGFGIVTRLENISPDGSAQEQRWATDQSTSIGIPARSYFQRLFTRVPAAPSPGFYRALLFTVTDVPFAAVYSRLEYAEVAAWLNHGFNTLPPNLGNQRVRPRVTCTALIYEFEEKSSSPRIQNVPSRIDAHTHLVKSGILGHIAGKPASANRQSR